MNIVINPTFQSFQSFVESVPQSFGYEGRTIYKGRNEIKVFQVNGIEVNVKKYRKPIFLNRIVYSFFRKTKASKAYYNAIKVVDLGFETPEAIAYIEEKSAGLLSYSYFISLQCPYPKEIRELYWGPLDGNETLFVDFARYTAALHDKGIYHLDYSPGNVLVGEKDGKFLFSLVDINRMKFIPVSLELGCQNFERMFENDAVYTLIATEYAKARGLDVPLCVKSIHKYKDLFLAKKARKKRIKKFFHLAK